MPRNGSSGFDTRGQGVCEDALTASAAENKPPFFGG